MRRKPALCEYPYLGLSAAHKAARPHLPSPASGVSQCIGSLGHASAVIAPLRPC